LFQSHSPLASLAEKGTLSERAADLEKRCPTNDMAKSFCHEDLLKRPIRAEETGRLTGRALISLSQRSDAQNVRRAGLGLVLQRPCISATRVQTAAKHSPRPLEASTPPQRVLYHTHSPFPQMTTLGCLVNVLMEPQSLSPRRKPTGH
jgi:hypothetical protein